MITARAAASLPSSSVTMVPANGQTRGPVGEYKLGTEQQRLLPRPVCQLASADPACKAQIVADQ
jgi:hypothetical protein